MIGKIFSKIAARKVAKNLTGKQLAASKRNIAKAQKASALARKKNTFTPTNELGFFKRRRAKKLQKGWDRISENTAMNKISGKYKKESAYWKNLAKEMDKTNYTVRGYDKERKGFVMNHYKDKSNAYRPNKSILAR